MFEFTVPVPAHECPFLCKKTRSTQRGRAATEELIKSIALNELNEQKAPEIFVAACEQFGLLRCSTPMNNVHLAVQFFVQIAVILLFCRLVGAIALRLNSMKSEPFHACSPGVKRIGVTPFCQRGIGGHFFWPPALAA